MNRPRRLGVVAVAGALAVALTGCVRSWLQAPLHLAIVDWPAYEYFYLASRAGIDHQEGLQLRVDQFGSLQDQRQAFSYGNVDAIATTLPEAMVICRETPSRCPVIVLVLDQSNGADQLISASALGSTAALKGQRVGLEQGMLGAFMLLRGLERVGLQLSDVRLHYDGPKALVDQLRRGAVAAIVTYSPHSDDLVNDPRWRVLFSSREIPGEVVDVLAVSPELMRSRPEQVKALVNTWWEARRWAAAKPDQAVALMAQRQGVAPRQFELSQRLISYPDQRQQAALLAANGPVQRTLQRLRQQITQAERLPGDVPLPRLQWVPSP